MSVGRPGKEADPRTLEVERRVIETRHNASVPCRAKIASVVDVKRYTDLGVRHFSLGYALFTLQDVLKDRGERLCAPMADGI